MGKSKFDRKKAVRFILVPGPFKDGKPTVLYKAAQNMKNRVPKKERKKLISKIADYDQITINGKIVDDDEIPAFVLDQIRGRNDLLFNQINKNQEEDEDDEQYMQGDLYDIQDAKEDAQYEEYDDQDDEQEEIQEKNYKPKKGNQIKEEENDDDWEDDQQWEEGDDEDQEDWQDDEGDDDDQEIIQVVPAKFVNKAEDFPMIEPLEDYQMDGKIYKLTKTQLDMLDTVIPQNYESMTFGGLQFKKYSEDGLPLSQKQKYEKYFVDDKSNIGIIDTFEFVPQNPIDILDTDLKPSEINSNASLKQVQQALNYDGQEQAYQELEDDFFAKLIQGELEDNKTKSSSKVANKEVKVAAKIVQKPAGKKQEVKVIETGFKKKGPNGLKKESQEGMQLDQALQKALHNFDHNIQDNNQDGLDDEEDDSDEQDDSFIKRGKYQVNYIELDEREQYTGRDGQLDWRMLTKDEKKQYMRTKKIEQNYDVLRKRQIQQKMRGKTGIDPSELHLKQLVKHIPYEEDHVMQKSLANDLAAKVDLDQSQESLSSVQEDDIVSFHQKTSILASNLSFVQQPSSRIHKPRKENVVEQAFMNRSKPISIKIDPNETPQQRKQRKKKLKQQKNQKKNQKKQFAQKFSKIRKQTLKKQNVKNPLNKVSYIKIY